jgi:phosphomannomutase/phosphoglucomutase
VELHPHIFREYDVRGIVGQDLDEEAAHRLGLSFGTLCRERRVSRLSLGRDNRLSSESLSKALTRGLVETGLRVIDLGTVPTPLLYFSLFETEAEGGVMVTGSHNPPDHNGFKLCVGKDALYGPQIQAIRLIAESGRFATGAKGSVESRDVIGPYRKFIRARLRLAQPVHVVADAGNGTAGLVAPPILRDLGCRVTELFCDSDGRFPNHHPDPTVPKNLDALIAAVKAERADFGIAFDGDADRLGVVDHEGRIIWGDQLLIIFSRDLLERGPATVLCEVKCSSTLVDDVEKRGGRIIMWRTGHSLIKAKMKEENAALAGEMSGHMFFADGYLGYDDAIYAGCRLVEIVSRTGKKIPELLAGIPRTCSTPEIRIDCPEERKFRLVEELKESLRGRYPIIDVDGVRVVFDGGWGLLRASNTQAILVLRFEAESEKKLVEIQRIFSAEMEKLGFAFTPSAA